MEQFSDNSWYEIYGEITQKHIKYVNEKTSIKIVYSSYHSIGEGEHKIMEDIREKEERRLELGFALFYL